jgi:hypothetical protein
MNKPEQHYNRLIFALVQTAFLLAAVYSAQAREPGYNGKSLSEWLVELHRKPSYAEMSVGTNQQTLEPEDIDKAYKKKREHDEEAIRKIGTNALPTLLEMLGARQENVKQVVAKLQSKKLQAEYASSDADVEDLRGLAVDGFGVLGANAASAIPQLSKLVYGSEGRLQAMRALTKVGPPGFSVVTNALAEKDSEVRNNAIWVLGENGGGDPTVVTELLIRALKDPDSANRGNAADFLAGKDPILAVPALTGMLDDTEYYPRSRAAISLGTFGPAAKSATPQLLSTYTNIMAGPDQDLIHALGPDLAEALKRIDPEAAAKAGIR